VLPDSLAAIRGPTSKGRGGEKGDEGRGMTGKRREGEEKGRDGKGQRERRGREGQEEGLVLSPT